MRLTNLDLKIFYAFKDEYEANTLQYPRIAVLENKTKMSYEEIEKRLSFFRTSGVIDESSLQLSRQDKGGSISSGTIGFNLPELPKFDVPSSATKDEIKVLRCAQLLYPYGGPCDYSKIMERSKLSFSRFESARLSLGDKRLWIWCKPRQKHFVPEWNYSPTVHKRVVEKS
jgi:hypothetical protein